ALPIWSAAEMTVQCERGLADAATAVDALKALDAKGDIKRTLREFDALGGIIQDVASIAGLMMSTSPDASVRTEASNCSKKWSAYWTSLYQDRGLFAKLPKQGGDAIDQKYLNDLRRRFESSGVQLDASKQEIVRKIRKEMNDLTLEFERTLRDNSAKVAFTPEEVRGVPAQVLDKAGRDDQGRYLLGFSYPEYIPFMDFAHSDEAKKRYYIAFTNRGGARNVAILAELAVLRDQLAKVMGYTTYASMVTQDRMAANPQAVIDFLENVRKAAEPREAKEIDEIKDFMKAQGAKEALSRWNIAYWQAKLRQSRYQINQEEVRAFFPTQASIEFSLDIASELYGVAFSRTTLPTWHESVTVWEVRRKGAMATDQPLGLIYLDLFPRPGKFTHAAAFPTRGVSRVLGRKPISVMVANFNDKGLNYSELRTLLHEFGHILHGVLRRGAKMSKR
ncbi:MAG: Zn-dependent oligopeptidase, partial [Betaproteobacteria bacterium]|nr:Zn-dependent oligopeptidase [Betaproteobacteria bacterium]